MIINPKCKLYYPIYTTNILNPSMMSDHNKVTKETKISKRPRVVLACNRCRQRKTKCDGQQPSCATCSKRNVECVYGSKYTRAHVTVEYVRELEEKLGIFPKTSAVPLSHNSPSISNMVTSDSDSYSMQRTPSVHLPQPPEIPRAQPISYPLHQQAQQQTHHHSGSIASNGSNGNMPHDNTDHTATSLTPSNSINSTSSALRRNNDSTDAMGAGAMMKQKRGKDRDYYGSSAAISFMKDLSNIIDGPVKSDTSTTDDDELDRGNGQYKMSRTEAMSSKRISELVLPPRAYADTYVKNYFEFAYTLYPFVHKPTFMATYETLWTGNKNVDDDAAEIDELFYSIVNIIFAFGCQLAPESQKLEDNSELYFERSQQALRFHLMDSGSVLLVQALLLTGQFLQASAGLAGCWNIVGLAIRIAQGLGLHLNQNYASTRSLIDREIRKRLWQGCLLMDRIVSMTMGRPLMVTYELEQGEVPLCVDDEYIRDEAILPMNKPSQLGFFTQTIKLYNILADILKSVYINDEPDDNPQLLLNVFKYEDRLNEFTANLPSHIQFSSDLQKMMPFERQSIVLHIRVLHLKIMLYRPALFPKASSSPSSQRKLLEGKTSELYSSTQRSIALLCINLAMELINVISKYRAGDIVYLPAHWYNVFYVYTASTILLAAKLQVTLHKDIDMAQFERTWNLGLEILRSYTQQSESACRCLKVLEMMGNKVNISSQRLATQVNTPVAMHGHNDNNGGIDQGRLNPSSSIFPFQPDYSPSSTSSEVPTDVLYSLLYDTAGPFGGPFHYNDETNAFNLR